MEVAAIEKVPPVQQKGHVRPGGTIWQFLLMDDAPDGLNFKLLRSQFQPGDAAFTSPRHNHAFQQIRFAESGRVNFGPDQFIEEGDLAYFPRGAWYGPQRKDEGVSLTLQFGFHGEHQSGEKWDATRQQALDRLKARGEFVDGAFVETDPVTGERRRYDAAQALYESQYMIHNREKFVVPAEGYDSPILIHPRAFEYYEAAPGLEIKHLGNFFDHAGPEADIRLSVLRLSGGSYDLGPGRAQVGWTRTAGLRVGDKAYDERACFYSRRGEELTLCGEDGVEVFIVEFPRLD